MTRNTSNAARLLHTRPIHAVLLASSFLAAPSCGEAGEIESVDVVELSSMTDEQKAIEVLIRNRGFDLTEIEPHPDGFVVQGDMVFSIENLLNEADRVIEKGFWCGTQLDGGTCTAGFQPIDVERIGIAFVSQDPLNAIVPPPVKTGFERAAFLWSTAHYRSNGTRVYLDAGVQTGPADSDRAYKKPPTSWIVVTFKPMSVGACGTVADAWPPYVASTGSVHHGNYININSNTSCAHMWLSSWNMINTALHEIGHALGFPHPEDDNDSVHIPGTGSSSTYRSIMRDGYASADYNAQYTDDNESLEYIYGESIADLPTALYGLDSQYYDTEFCDTDLPWMINGCDLGEGDCDGLNTSNQCKGHLVCASNQGPRYELRSDFDVCEKPNSCPRYLDEVSTTYCNDALCPCEPWEGDCDLDAHCGGRLLCGSNRGLAAGRPESWDMCILPPLPNCPTFNKGDISSYAEFCSTTCPCNLGEGDCDSDSECRGNLICARGVGAQLGYTGAQANWQYCVSPSFYGSPPDTMSDPECDTGIASGNVCCADSCGSCGGSGCSGRPGGSYACCTGTVSDVGQSCNDRPPPCVMD